MPFASDITGLWNPHVGFDHQWLTGVEDRCLNKRAKKIKKKKCSRRRSLIETSNTLARTAYGVRPVWGESFRPIINFRSISSWCQWPLTASFCLLGGTLTSEKKHSLIPSHTTLIPPRSFLPRACTCQLHQTRMWLSRPVGESPFFPLFDHGWMLFCSLISSAAFFALLYIPSVFKPDLVEEINLKLSETNLKLLCVCGGGYCSVLL